MQIQTDASCGLISSGPWADLVTLRIQIPIQIEVPCKFFSVRAVAFNAVSGAFDEYQGR